MENLLALVPRAPVGSGSSPGLRIYTWRTGYGEALRVTAHNVMQARAVAVGGVLLKELFNLKLPADVELLKRLCGGRGTRARDGAAAP